MLPSQVPADFGLMVWKISGREERQNFVRNLLPRQEMIRSMPVRDFNIVQERYHTALEQIERSRKHYEQQHKWVREASAANDELIREHQLTLARVQETLQRLHLRSTELNARDQQISDNATFLDN
jgi:hypothetical protein